MKKSFSFLMALITIFSCLLLITAPAFAVDNSTKENATVIKIGSTYSDNVTKTKKSAFFTFTITAPADRVCIYMQATNNTVFKLIKDNYEITNKNTKYDENKTVFQDYVLGKGKYYIEVNNVDNLSNVNISLRVSKISFPDVSDSAWYAEAVKYNARKAYITGYTNGNFGPGDSLKRQDFVVILARISNADLSTYQNMTPKNSDVKNSAYYAAAVNWATSNNIVSGYANGKFGVNDPITREQICTILYKYKNSPSVSNVDKTLNNFGDGYNVSSFAKTPVAWAIQKGVISGTQDRRIAPTKTASRAEIATIIMNMDQKEMFK